MKVIILAGGLPSTLIEKDEKLPKPMAEIGGRPILWHIMKQYAYYGYNDFIICTGYKGDVIKNYFMNFYIYQSDITVDLKTNDVLIHRKKTEDWKVSIIDTGLNSSVIERLVMVKDLVDGDNALVSYGDCISNINVKDMFIKHINSEAVATVAVAHPTGRNEILALNSDGRYRGLEKSEKQVNSWVNACNMVVDKNAFDYWSRCIKEKSELSLLNCLGKYEDVQTYCHEGFWVPVETIRDKTYMQYLWDKNIAPWKVWND